MGGSHLHVRCMARIVNLIVQDDIKEINVSTERVRQAVRYIRPSPTRWKKFQECCEDENLVKKYLCLDVPTRWSSTYIMLSRAIEYECAILDYADRDIGLVHHLKYIDNEDGIPMGILLSSDLESVKRIEKFLEMFFKLTLKIYGSRYVTSNLQFLEICQVGIYLKQLISIEDKVLVDMAVTMKEKFDKYWGDTDKMNKMLFIPCVLDPRHKFSTLSFALNKLFGDKEENIESGVRTYMKSLFNEYENPISNDKGGQVFEESGSGSIPIGDFGNFIEELHRHTSRSGCANSKIELDKYLEEDTEIGKAHFDVLLWWKVNSPRFPFLSEMARDVLAIPISSVASECVFSIGGCIIDSFRRSLTPKMVQALVCLQDWLRSEPHPIILRKI